MQTLASLLKINEVQPAIHQSKITVYRCTVSQCSSSPCRCNLSMKLRPRAPTMFWLIVPVSVGHLGLPVILHITHICPNKRHTLTEGMRTFRYTKVHTLQVHIVTHRPTDMATSTHKDTQTKKASNAHSLMCESNSCSDSQATLQGIHYYWCQTPQQEVMAEPPAVCTV